MRLMHRRLLLRCVPRLTLRGARSQKSDRFGGGQSDCASAIPFTIGGVAPSGTMGEYNVQIVAMKVKIAYANEHGPLSLSRLNDFETRTRIRLPEDYRQFLLENNGGQPEPAFFWIKRPVDGSRVHRFYGLFEGKLPPSLYAYAGADRRGVPAGLLPIGDDGVGNLICIGVAAPRYGGVFFLDHDALSWRHPNANGAINRLADSFSSFLLSLMEDPRGAG